MPIDPLYQPPCVAQADAPGLPESLPEQEAPVGLFGSLVVLTCGCGPLSLFLFGATLDAFDRWWRLHDRNWEGDAVLVLVVLATLSLVSAALSGAAIWAAAACSGVPAIGTSSLLSRLRTLIVTAAVGAIAAGGITLWAMLTH